MLLITKTVLSFALVVANPVAAVWPIPQNISTGDTTLLINENIAVTYNGVSLTYTHGYEASDIQNSENIVQGGVSRALDAIFQTGLVPWKLHPKNSLSSFEPDLKTSSSLASVHSLVIKQTTLDTTNTTKAKAGTVDESYGLTVSVDGVASLTATTSVGVLRGLATFEQLFYAHTSGTAWYTPLAPVVIKDAPKYKHRGVMLDVARNWYELTHIYRTIDAVAWNKMNRLHLHMTDSQSWPLEIPTMPEIAAKGAYRSDLTYTSDDLKALQRYAVARGVDLVVEIDMPGHIGSLALSHPELIVAYDAFPYFWWCAEPPCGAFKLNDTAVDAFVEKLLDDVLPRVAPYSAYFHTGGDELNANDSRLDPGVGTDSKAVLQPLLQRFIDANHKRVRAEGLVPIVWEEIPLTWNVTVGKDTGVQTWLGASSIKEMTGRGLQVVDSNYNFYYLDCGRGQWLNWDNGLAYAAGYPFGDWCSPHKNWRLVYSYDPVTSAGLTAEEAALVAGGEVAVWSEAADGTNLDGLLWPRGSAAAEALWSGNTDPATGQNRSQLTVTPRLAEWRERMVAHGVMAEPVQMVWCTQANNSTECSQPTGPGY
ncbi:beta-hexosaminidase beta chain precursor [Grosmannia clavigera kw1407]|uniref:Beta-hexosaminidase n=1 Tax=Grosmannia clavigera (strain kw1407 / UAMH 11150) TaxID=655863 RepID=F0XHG7_GROCL|nr:beta-hexosaminidase beta chain precursor [Grosmannia clavigera kw1407]EFX03281.1 beta-hexosaminidase beta chain precursor [Grosmannia clavigera kw1407]